MGVGGSERSPCVASQSSSVRSVVVLSLHQNGLSIGQSAVFGTYGSVRRADISLNTPSISPHQRSSLILRIEETSGLPNRPNANEVATSVAPATWQGSLRSAAPHSICC